MEDALHFDVIIIGAGLSGVAAAAYLKDELPEKTFAVLEARDALGGTWDLFRYPGIRSDSDMHTLGFSFYPWPNPQAIADGPSILRYLNDTVDHYGLRSDIRLEHRVERAAWSSDDRRWTITACDAAGEELHFTCSFLWGCTGYYKYEHGYMPDFDGADTFEGELIHPQHWPEDLDYSGKRIVVIGSGATAVTLVPEMSKTAHVTMLQRSPSYVMSVPGDDMLSEGLKKVFGDAIGSTLTRWKNVLRLQLFFQASRRFPNAIRKHIIGQVRDQVGDVVDVDTHFSPSYNPWEQRLCFVPDDDLFDALREERADIVTAHIDRFTPTGIRLQDGREIEADIIVSATGLVVEVAGGAELFVDGERVDPGQRYLYKGAMVSGVPNHAMSLGYTNASWTLKCELIAQYVVRVLRHMDEHDYDVCFPPDPNPDEVGEEPLIDFNSGYVTRALDRIPKQGEKLPWRLYQNYFLDQYLYGRTAVDDDVLTFR